MKSQTQVANVMGKRVNYNETAQGNGYSFDEKSGELKKNKSNYDWLKSIIDESEEKDIDKSQDSVIVGGQGPEKTKLFDFKKMPSYGEKIAIALQNKRGY